MAKKKKKQKEQNGTEGTKKENEVDEDLRGCPTIQKREKKEDKYGLISKKK